MGLSMAGARTSLRALVMSRLPDLGSIAELARLL
jgi:hypothetical protein